MDYRADVNNVWIRGPYATPDLASSDGNNLEAFGPSYQLDGAFIQSGHLNSSSSVRNCLCAVAPIFTILVLSQVGAHLSPSHGTHSGSGVCDTPHAKRSLPLRHSHRTFHSPHASRTPGLAPDATHATSRGQHAKQTSRVLQRLGRLRLLDKNTHTRVLAAAPLVHVAPPI